jgi:hypothetical protein
MPKSQADFQYQNTTLDDIWLSLSAPRMATYMREAGHKRLYAAQLYKWNAQLAGALVFSLHIAEISLRNALHQGLTAEFGANWPFDGRLRGIARSSSQLHRFVERAVKKSESRIGSEGKTRTTDQVVANMSFEFWTGILHQDYGVDVWDKHLRAVFPNLAGHEGRADVESLALSVKSLRNRVSHHEPVFGAAVDLTRRHGEIIRLIRLRNQQTSRWVRDHSRVMSVLREKPVAPGSKPVGGPPLRGRIYKNIPVVPDTTPISDLAGAINPAQKYILVKDAHGVDHVVGPSTIYGWLVRCPQNCGLADLAGTTAFEFITAGLCLSHTYCLADISEWEARFIFEKRQQAGNPVDVLILTTSGGPGGPPGNLVGIADQLLL